MKKIDLKKEYRKLYSAQAKFPVRVKVPKLNFLMVDGSGDPNTSLAFKEAIEALYSFSYTIKFALKKGKPQVDYGVPPLEGLWWTDDMADFSIENKGLWKWTMMIMQPKYVTRGLVNRIIKEVRQKKELPALGSIRFESFAEGRSAQILHIGPFSTEGPTIQKLHSFIAESGSTLRDKHHEIYLSDFRRVAPEKWKTILRQPME
jgi:hypothetical protein